MTTIVDTTHYKIGVVLSVEDLKSTGGKPLKLCQVKVGETGSHDDDIIPVVTAATNVRQDSRVVVAPVGSKILDEDGDTVITVSKSTVGGRPSCGVLCDSKMLGWPGGAQGIAVQVPASFDIGSPPPPTKPGRPTDGDSTATDTAGSAAGGLFEKKLSKEEKKKLAAEKRAAKKAAKEAAATS